MTSFILDSSIAISWFMEDELGSSLLLDKTANEGAIVPSIWLFEIANVFLHAQKAKRITISQHQQALNILQELPIEIEQANLAKIWFETTHIAMTYRLTVYDASYLELSLRKNLPLATLDKALRQSAQICGITVLGK